MPTVLLPILSALRSFFGTWPGAFIIGGVVCSLWWGLHVSSAWQSRYEAREKQLVAETDAEAARRSAAIRQAYEAASEQVDDLKKAVANLTERQKVNDAASHENDSKSCLDRAAVRRLRHATD